MPPTIAVLGANGVYARHLIPRLTAAGNRVRALVRRPEAASFASACGAETALADIFDTSTMTAALAGCDIGINLATSLPGPSGRGDFAANDKLRVEGAVNWITACKAAGVERIIQQSIGMLCASGSDAWSDEGAAYAGAEDTVATRAFAASLQMEETIRASNIDWIILRGGLFYGPGTGFDDAWHARAASGKLRLPEDGEAYVSLVRIEDMAAATVRAIDAWRSRATLIICDDEPAPWREVFGYLCAMHGQPPPQAGAPLGFPSFRLRNARAKDVLGWSPFHSTWRMGLVR